LTDFTPDALSSDTYYIGTGAIANANGDIRYTCHRNLVRQIDSNCVISSLIFSHGIPHFSPIQEFGLSPGLSIVGYGPCKDSGGKGYAYVYRDIQAFDLNRAYGWCKTANNYASKLVAVEVGTNAWACLYEGSFYNNIQTAAFTPNAKDKGPGDGSGTHVTVPANGQRDTICLKNEVRRIDFNCN
jgi:hypothetical protein